MFTVRAVWLRGPRANRPGELSVLTAVSLHTKILRALRRNTENSWDYATVTLTVQPGVGTYEVPDTRFGRPLAVVTIDPANANHIQRLIPFYTPQNLVFNWGWPTNIGAWVVNYDGSFHSAERVAFYWTDGVPYIQFQPIPQLTAQYVLQFSMGDSVDVMSLQDELHLGEIGDSLVEIRATRSLLPSTEWEGMDQKYNSEMRKEIAMSLTADEGLLAHQFSSDSLIGTGQSLGQLWSPLDEY